MLVSVGFMTVQKKACTDPGCNPCDISKHCLDADDEFDVGVECWKNGDYTDNGKIETTFKVIATSNARPTFTFRGVFFLNYFV